MTMPRYQVGCAAGSQVCGEAANPDWAWGVNFNNGNVNNNHRDNTGYVRAVRRVPAGECQGVGFKDLYAAWQRARRKKQASHNQMSFETNLLDHLVDLEHQLNAGTWQPSPSTCFIASAPKAREIHAPDFSDRVVHHWLAPQLEAIYERTFIHDSHANRKNKGTHAAVDQLRRFVHQVNSGQGGGWYLQLDVHNFFNSIHRPTLYRMLKTRMEKHSLSEIAQHVVHALLRRSPLHNGVIYRATAAERAAVPMHKRLENAAPGCGLPIGNLSSQFFANVYLDQLDQFAKHELKARRYLRYVDDFVLVHHDREHLQKWQLQIETFLSERLQVRLKADVRLRPLSAGIDFLGYVVYPTHTRVRRRVVSHARERIEAWARECPGCCTRDQLEQLQAIWSSYSGHFMHADAWRLKTLFEQRYPRLLSKKRG